MINLVMIHMINTIVHAVKIPNESGWNAELDGVHLVKTCTNTKKYAESANLPGGERSFADFVLGRAPMISTSRFFFSPMSHF